MAAAGGLLDRDEWKRRVACHHLRELAVPLLDRVELNHVWEASREEQAAARRGYFCAASKPASQGSSAATPASGESAGSS